MTTYSLFINILIGFASFIGTTIALIILLQISSYLFDKREIITKGFFFIIGFPIVLPILLIQYRKYKKEEKIINQMYGIEDKK